jgi:RNA polymerase sigma factor (sigma-70 family)
MLPLTRDSEVNFGSSLVAHAAAVKRFIASRRIGGADLDDLTQECLLRVWRSRDRLVEHPNITAYIIAVTKNLTQEHRRTQMRSLAFDGRAYLAARPTAPTETETCRRELAVRAAIEGLPPKLREAVEARYFGATVAPRSDAGVRCAPGTLRRRLDLARRRLRVVLAWLPPGSDAAAKDFLGNGRTSTHSS